MKKITAAVACILLMTVGILAGCNKEPQPADRLSQYIKLWNEQKFAEMYDYLSQSAQEKITKQKFVDRYEKVYSDLEISKLQIDFKKPENEDKVKEDHVEYPFSEKMESVAGPIQFDHKAQLVKETKDNKDNWYIDWDTTYIFPQLGGNDKIGLSTTPALRGEIQDRNGQQLAVNGTVYEIGIVPGEMGDQKDAVIEQVSSLLGVSIEKIQNALNASWVQPDYFVPIKQLSLEQRDLVANVTSLPSVKSKQVGARVYPLKEAAAHLIGYVGPITAEELKDLSGKGYGANDVIGKRGIEQVLEDRLKGENGATITIKKSDGTQEVLAKREVKDGENVQLTIDANVQNQLYGQLSGEAGTAAAIHPITGETLGLVSAPSFDPNLLAIGATASEWEALENNPQKPLLTRFKATYAPGSVMKPITAAIALKEGAINPETTIQVSGLQWQKDASWGNYFVTRVHDVSTPVNLEKAMLYSDNIYFAQAALALAKDPFTKGLKEFAFEEEIPYLFPLESSKIGSLDSEIKIADSGYGQAEIEMSIVHLATAYTTFTNGGNMITPTLLLNEEKAKVWKQQVMSTDQASQINSMLQKVVNDPEGTAYKANGLNLAGKTGTAELKAKQGEQGTENGWFIAYNTDNPSMLVAMMIEGVQGRGGSGYVVDKVRNIFAGQ